MNAQQRYEYILASVGITRADRETAVVQYERLADRDADTKAFEKRVGALPGSVGYVADSEYPVWEPSSHVRALRGQIRDMYGLIRCLLAALVIVGVTCVAVSIYGAHLVMDNMALQNQISDLMVGITRAH